MKLKFAQMFNGNYYLGGEKRNLKTDEVKIFL